MLRSRLLFLVAALGVLAACHSGGEARAPTARTETTAADARPFPADDARTALHAAAPGLRACRTDAGPSKLDATVRFDPNGKVSKVDVTPEAEPAASCVKKKLAEVAVMPFDGAPVTMTTRVAL